VKRMRSEVGGQKSGTGPDTSSRPSPQGGEGVASAAAAPGERLWKRKELAPVLRVSLRTLDTMVALGEIPCLRLRGRLIRFRLEDVLRKLKGE
jgi:excisionase family DNA binding protein